MFPHLGVAKLPPEVTVDRLPTVAFLQAFLDAYGVARALQATDIQSHSTATARARSSYRAVHHGLDPEPYHARLIGQWDHCLLSLAERALVAYNAALALEAADIRWHSAATTHA